MITHHQVVAAEIKPAIQLNLVSFLKKDLPVLVQEAQSSSPCFGHLVPVFLRTSVMARTRSCQVQAEAGHLEQCLLSILRVSVWYV